MAEPRANYQSFAVTVYFHRDGGMMTAQYGSFKNERRDSSGWHHQRCIFGFID
jgi:hypothetical protein